MARGDASFARVNIDWPFDPRCRKMPDDSCRWFNHMLWVLSVKHRSPVIPWHYDPEWWRESTKLDNSILDSYVRMQCDLNLIQITEDHLICVIGVVEQHAKLIFKYDYPEVITNPWVMDPDYSWTERAPTTALDPYMGKIRTKKEKKKSEVRRDDPYFVQFWDQYPKKVAKEAARLKYAQARMRATHREIMAGVKRSAAHWKREKTARQYIPNPSTWLHNERWSDFIGEPEIKNDRPELPDPQKVRKQEADSEAKHEILNEFYKLSKGVGHSEVESASAASHWLGNPSSIDEVTLEQMKELRDNASAVMLKFKSKATLETAGEIIEGSDL